MVCLRYVIVNTLRNGDDRDDDDYDNNNNLTINRTLQSVIINKEHVFINLLKTKRNLVYIRNQSVPRCKHFPPRL